MVFPATSFNNVEPYFMIYITRFQYFTSEKVSSPFDSANTIKFCWIDLKLNRLSDFNVNLVKPAINGIKIIYIRLHIRNFIEFNGALQLDLKKSNVTLKRPHPSTVENCWRVAVKLIDLTNDKASYNKEKQSKRFISLEYEIKGYKIWSQ